MQYMVTDQRIGTDRRSFQDGTWKRSKTGQPRTDWFGKTQSQSQDQGLKIIAQRNRSDPIVKVFENFLVDLIWFKVKKFQALRVKTLTWPTPRFESSYDV